MKILIAVDGSKSSIRAVKYAITFANQGGFKYEVQHGLKTDETLHTGFYSLIFF